MTTFTGAGIDYFRLAVLKNAVSLEACGIRTRGGSKTALAKREYGIKGNRDKVLAFLTAKLEGWQRGREEGGMQCPKCKAETVFLCDGREEKGNAAGETWVCHPDYAGCGTVFEAVLSEPNTGGN